VLLATSTEDLLIIHGFFCIGDKVVHVLSLHVYAKWARHMLFWLLLDAAHGSTA
jgi:hypothetical protein